MKLFIKYLMVFLMVNSNLYAQEWQNFSMPDDTTIFHKMCQIDNYCWAIDYGHGRVFNSKDSGESWTLQFEAQGEYLEEIQFLDKNTGFLCGDFGIILKTTDGGNTWKEIGPEYAPRATKANQMTASPDAIGRYYYQMYFKNEEKGLVWCFEILFPPETGWKDRKTYFYKTIDGGSSWEKIEYEEEEYDKITASFLMGTELQQEMAMEIYYANGKAYKTGRHGIEGIKISDNDGQSWETYPLPQHPDRRYILRSIHFINEHQGYIFGGNLEEKSSGYIYETLDEGKTWHSLETTFPHIHYSLQKDNEILLAGKEGLLKKWTPAEKEIKSFIHKGNSSKILIDGQVEKQEWTGANKTSIKPGVDLYTLHDEHYLYLSYILI